MWIKNLVVVLGVFCVVQAFAKKEAIYFGGGGEPEGAKTQFDGSFKNYMGNLKSAGWKIQSYFNGGHSDSEELAQKMSNNTNKSMTSENASAAIKNLKKRILNGELTSGDQLLVTIDTHGAANSDQDTHLVATTDGFFNLDELRSLRSLAEKKGIQLAIIDTSCYSGNTLLLGSSKTCVVTTATASDVGYTHDAEALFRSLHLSGNLEAAYLGSRADPNVSSLGAPQISTAAGKIAGKQTEALGRRMASDERLLRDLNKDVVCDSKDKEQLEELISNLQEIDQAQKSNVDLVPELRKAFDEYQVMRDEALKAFKETGELNQRACVRVDREDICGTYDMFQKIVKDLKNRKLDSAWQENLRTYEQVTNSSDFEKYKKSDDKFQELTRQIRDKAFKIVQAERKAYRQIYNSNMGPNPCRDFKL
jgi:hypothetical protein